jgi:hypothetical protein
MVGLKRVIGPIGERLLVELDDGDEAWVEDGSMVAGDKQLRRVDLVEKLVREGEIGESERRAAERFAEDYFKSGSRPRYAASRAMIEEIAGGGGAAPEIPLEARRAAWERHDAACRAIGAYASETLIEVLCLLKRMVEYARRDRPKRKAAALCGLQGLAAHYRRDR